MMRGRIIEAVYNLSGRWVSLRLLALPAWREEEMSRVDLSRINK